MRLLNDLFMTHEKKYSETYLIVCEPKVRAEVYIDFAFQ